MLMWLNKKFYRRIIVLITLTLGLMMTLTLLLLNTLLNHHFLEALKLQHTEECRLIASEIEPALFAVSPSPRLQAKAKEMAQAAAKRVTFIRTDGQVLGDSDVADNEITKVENHLDRPEVRLALEGKEAHSIRHSHTVNTDLLYSAATIQNNGKTAGIIRLAMSLGHIQANVKEIQTIILTVGLPILFLAILGAALIFRRVTRPLETISNVARQMANGQYKARIKISSEDELGHMGATLNLLAEKVHLTITELSDEKTQLSAVLNNMVEGVIAVDNDFRILVLNPALEKLFNIQWSASHGRPLLEILRHSQLENLMRRALNESTPQIGEIQTFSPEERIFEAGATPLMDNGQTKGVILVLHDITRLRRLEQVRKDFVDNVSHELKTPLSAIKGFAETLIHGGLADKEHNLEFTQAIEKHADRMSHLVDDLLDLTAVESGKRLPQKTSFPLKEIIDEIEESLRPLLVKKGVVVKSNIPADFPLISADRTQIRQVLTNLLDNAVKFNKEKGGTASVEAEAKEGTITISVKDNGIGIPSQDLPRLFERFYRVDKARSRDMGGTGLGLSIVKHIIESHGGAVGVESAIGKGSRFFFTLHNN